MQPSVKGVKKPCSLLYQTRKHFFIKFGLRNQQLQNCKDVG